MKILAIADEECPSLWDYYRPGCLSEYELILSSGDLNAKYLSFLVTMARCPVMYVCGNHDRGYAAEPPEGCDPIDDKLVVYKGVRILGLGGCLRYSNGAYQYSEREMQRRIRKLKRAIQLAGGVDIVLTHAAPLGVGDWDDRSHQGFASFLELIDQYHPCYLIHGHVHLNYGQNIPRIREYAGTKVINCCQKYELEYEKPKIFAGLTGFWRLYAKLFVKNLEIQSL